MERILNAVEKSIKDVAVAEELRLVGDLCISLVKDRRLRFWSGYMTAALGIGLMTSAKIEDVLFRKLDIVDKKEDK